MVSHKPIRVVDEFGEGDEIVGTPDQAVVEGKIRLISRVIIVNKKGEYLLQKRAKYMRGYPDCWENAAGGHVDEGEDPEQTAYRELEEEVGISTVLLRHIGEYYSETPIDTYPDFIGKLYNHVFIGQFDGDIGELLLEPNEVSEIRWFTRAEIDELLAMPRAKVTDGLRTIFGEKQIV